MTIADMEKIVIEDSKEKIINIYTNNEKNKEFSIIENLLNFKNIYDLSEFIHILFLNAKFLGPDAIFIITEIYYAILQIDPHLQNIKISNSLNILNK